MSKIGYLFPGQGAQFVGMGKDLYDQSPIAKKLFDEADALFGQSLTRYCFEGPEDALTRTSIAQPAIFVTSIAALEIIKNDYPELKPSFVAGLSLGEFSALVAAESLSFKEGFTLVKKRAEAMEKSAQNNPGTMASIMGLSQTDCETIANESGAEVANLNATDQIVLSGTAESITKACELAEGKGAKRAIPLKVGGAFHSSLMREAKEDLEKAINETTIQAPQCTFVPNASAQATAEPSQIAKLLAEQLMSSVRWVETMQRSQDNGVTHFLEIGPGKVLKGLARRFNREFQVDPCGTLEDIKKVENLFAKS